jgi:hypothetical protein
MLPPQVLFLGWPLYSKVPGFRSVRQLHRFAWLLTSIALLVWHAVVFEVLLQQPQQRWTGALDMATCSSHAVLLVRAVTPAYLRGVVLAAVAVALYKLLQRPC